VTQLVYVEIKSSLQKTQMFIVTEDTYIG
jgi:hypothetical protein